MDYIHFHVLEFWLLLCNLRCELGRMSGFYAFNLNWQPTDWQKLFLTIDWRETSEGFSPHAIRALCLQRPLSARYMIPHTGSMGSYVTNFLVPLQIHKHIHTQSSKPLPNIWFLWPGSVKGGIIIHIFSTFFGKSYFLSGTQSWGFGFSIERSCVFALGLWMSSFRVLCLSLEFSRFRCGRDLFVYAVCARSSLQCWNVIDSLSHIAVHIKFFWRRKLLWGGQDAQANAAEAFPF